MPVESVASRGTVLEVEGACIHARAQGRHPGMVSLLTFSSAIRTAIRRLIAVFVGSIWTVYSGFPNRTVILVTAGVVLSTS